MTLDDAKKLINTEKSIRMAQIEADLDDWYMICQKFKAFCDGVYQAYQISNGMTPYPFNTLDNSKGDVTLHTYAWCGYVELAKKANSLQIERSLL